MLQMEGYNLYVNTNTIVIITFCWVAYAAIWFRVKRWQSTSIHSSTNANANPNEIFRRVSRSLLVFLMQITFQWALGPLFNIIIQSNVFGPQFSQKYAPTIIMACFSLSSAMMPPALFFLRLIFFVDFLFYRVRHKK